jgi:hypothetical protein
VNAYKAAAKWLYAEYEEQWPVEFETHLATLAHFLQEAVCDGEGGRQGEKHRGEDVVGVLHAFPGVHEAQAHVYDVQHPLGQRQEACDPRGVVLHVHVGLAVPSVVLEPDRALEDRRCTHRSSPAAQLSWTGDHLVINILISK